MTVKELIKILKTYDQNLEVAIWDYEYDEYELISKEKIKLDIDYNKLSLNTIPIN